MDVGHEPRLDDVRRLRACLDDLFRVMAPRVVELAAVNERLEKEVTDLRRAEEAVGERERESRLIMDTIPGMVAILTAAGELEVLNRQLLEYFGQTRQELTKWATNGTIHSDDLSHVIDVFSRAIASGNPYEIVQRFRRFDGVYRWFQNRGFPLRDRRGQIAHWCVLLTDIDEQKRAEDALRESERESRLIVDSIPGLVVALTPGGEVEFVNRQTLDYFGKTLEELKHWDASNVGHPEDLPRVLERFTHSISSGDPFDFEVRARRYDGVYRWFQSRGFPLRDSHGHIVRWYNLLIDIDERKRAETRLAGEIRLLEMIASGRSLGDILDWLCRFVEETATNCHCGVYLIDWSGPTFQTFAPTLPASFNDALEGVAVDPEIGPCAMAACLKTQVIAANIESDPLWETSPFRALALANGLRSCWSTPIYSLAGSVLGTFAIYQQTPGSPTPLQQDLISQVTHIARIAIERAQSEAALKRSEAFLADGQRLSLTGSFCWRVATGEITWSDELYRIYDIEIGTPVTFQLIRTRVHPEDISLLERMKIIHQAHGGVDAFEWQYRLLMPDRSIKYLHAVAHAIRGQDGELEYIAAVQDVTERRLSEEALARARSELTKVASSTSVGVLTAAIAHEVNQPLSGIMTNAGTCLRMLDATPPNIEGARETARRTIRDGNRAADVITRLRALFSKREFTLEALDLNDATREVIALSMNDLHRNRIILESQFADGLPTVTGDRIQLQQVILNLLRNASDAMAGVQDRPRHLLIRTEADAPRRVRLTVRDAGVGLPAENLDSLFDAFFTTKSGGMGIGLFVSRSIVERHDGQLWAEPNGDSPGATFSFSLPIAAELIS